MHAGTIEMASVIGISTAPGFDRFKTFLNVLEVYGTGYQDEVWSFRAEELTHRDRVLKELRLIVHLFELAISALDHSITFRDSFVNR